MLRCTVAPQGSWNRDATREDGSCVFPKKQGERPFWGRLATVGGRETLCQQCGSGVEFGEGVDIPMKSPANSLYVLPLRVSRGAHGDWAAAWVHCFVAAPDLPSAMSEA